MKGKVFMKDISTLLKSEHLALTTITFGSFVFYLLILTTSPLIYGIDGPYYLIQVRSLLETGQLHYGDPPLAFFLFTFFTILLGGDMTLGVKAGVALFSSFSAVPLYFLVKCVSKNQSAGYVAMIVGIFSAPHIRLMNDLLKNAVGACFLLFFVYYLQEVWHSGQSWKNLFLTIFFLVLTGATHVLDFGIAILFLSLYLVASIALDIKKSSFVKSAVLIILVLAAFLAAAFLMFPSLFTDFNKGLSFLRDLFSATESTSPLLFLIDPRGGGLIIPILAVGAILAVYEWRMRKKEAAAVLFVVTILGLMLSFPLIPQEWLWRFLLMEFIPIAFIIGYSTSKIERRIILSIFLLLCVFPLVIQSFEVARLMGPTINEEAYDELVILTSFVPANSVILVTPRIMYWVEYITRQDIAKRLTQELWQSYSHVLLLYNKERPTLLPPKNATKLFEGEKFILFELPLPLFFPKRFSP